MKSIKNIATVAGACLALSGCGTSKHSAEEFVRKNLKDPDSARFGDFYYNSTTKQGCMTVNAKNSMGGYTGDQQVELIYNKDGWVWLDEKDESADDCRKEFADVTFPGGGSSQ